MALMQRIFAVLLVVAMVVVWVAVQRAWQRSFAGATPAADEVDALAVRRGCDGCGCGRGECLAETDTGRLEGPAAPKHGRE